MHAKIDHILIRYGELSTKKKNRKFFVQKLIFNIREHLKAYPKIKVLDKYDRILVQLNDEPMDDVIEILKNIFGIANFTPIVKCETDPDKIADLATYHMSLEKLSTFKVISRRKVKNLPFNSDQLNRIVASQILSNTDHKVDVHNPDIKIRIEVDADETHIGVRTYQGLQGLPVGVSGKALLLMSGGIDSPVAAYLMMKRGVKVECVHFATPPYTSPQSMEKVETLVRHLTKYQPVIALHVVDFTKTQQELYRPIDTSYGITLMRRAFVRIANWIADERKCLAIVTGDSIGQVASQTLESIQTIQEVSKLPMFRPLLTYDKLEIVNLAKQINTYETSILPFEDCCSLFAVSNPKTKPRLDFTLVEENKCLGLDELMNEAYSSKVTEFISAVHEEDYL